MSVLVVYASEHGSTKGIAERIAARLEEHGIATALAPADAAPDPAAYDAVVLGSAVHNSRWLPQAEAFVRQNRRALRQRPVWFFSVSSNGDEESFFPKPVANGFRRLQKEPRIRELRAIARPRGHRNFAGAIEREHWGRVGDLFLHALGGRNGDHRNWPAIDAWADAITTALAAPEAARETQPVTETPRV